ncbi:MAG: hypothetical protein M3Y33_05320 [Actinomycetota bacterium]|nr:hypothetical protein [Actinomycetota bacterium]
MGGVADGASGFIPVGLSSRPKGSAGRSRDPGGFPALPEPGQREVSGELAATKPHWPACAVDVVGQGDREAGDLSSVARAEPLPDQHSALFQPAEELGFV